MRIDNGATLDVNGTAPGATITFQGSAGVLIAEQAGAVNATIGGFVIGDTIELTALPFAPGATASGANGLLTVTSGASSMRR